MTEAADITTTVRTWILPESATERATERLDRVNKRITRAGLTPYGYTFAPADPLPEFDDRGANGSTTHDGIDWPTRDGVLCRLVCWHERVTLTVTGEVPHFEGWDFVATIVRDEHAGTMTRVVPGLEINLDALRDRDASECDHCRQRRDRNKVYAVRNTETGQILQVGSTCLASFLGIQVSIADVAYDDGIDEELAGMDGGGGFASGDRSYTPADVLAVAFYVVAKHGWIPRSRSYMGVPTGSVVCSLLNPPPRDRIAVEASRAMWAALSDDDRRHGAAALEYARTLDVASPRSNEYEKNLRAVALGERVSVSNVGLLASAISGYNRHVERVLADAVPRKPSEHQGVKDAKWLFRALTVTRVDPQENHFGYHSTTSYRVKFIDTYGNRFMWYANRFDFEPGARLDVVGTVKKHDTYTPEARDGQEATAQHETQLTRCTVSESAYGPALEHAPAPVAKRAGKRAAKASPAGPAQYVVTFDPRPVAGPGAIEGLRRMTLAEAHATLTVADRIPKSGRIIDAVTLATVVLAEPVRTPAPAPGEAKNRPAETAPVDLDVACAGGDVELDEWEALAAAL